MGCHTWFYKDSKRKVDHESYHDLFRKSGYPETVLYSLEETLEYINDDKNECEVFDFTEEELVKFWAECPNGSIDFG